MSLSIPNTFSNGQTIDPAAMNANFAAVVAKFAGGQVTTSELASPNGLFYLEFGSVAGTLAAGTYRFAKRLPAAIAVIPVQFESYFYSTAGSPSLSIQGSDATSNLLTSALTSSSSDAATVKRTTSFNLATIAADKTLTVTVTLTTASIVDFSCGMWCKAAHQA